MAMLLPDTRDHAAAVTYSLEAAAAGSPIYLSTLVQNQATFLGTDNRSVGGQCNT